jgi:signal transduction histidine kinase
MFLPDSRAMFDRILTQVGVLDFEELLGMLLMEIALLLNVERAAYYRMEEGGEGILLVLQYILSTGLSTKVPLRLAESEYPGYFAALRDRSNLVIAHDAMDDPRLSEFRETYFSPLGITSMFDIPVLRTGKLLGVICLEHVGPPRRWTEQEVDIGRSAGHLIALAVETQDRKNVEEELRQALERERELVEMKTNFVNLVSHEFRTPLGVIYSAADILKTYFDRLREDQREDHLHDIRYSARQMSNLMEEVLLVGKVESARMTCRLEPLDLTDFCRRLVEEQQAAAGGGRLILMDISGINGMARGDEGLLRHILGNLLSNALKYSTADVRFVIRREGAIAQFEIIDEGIGIDPMDRDQLYTAFHRGRNVGDSPGTGLGLVIVKRCVTLHGGLIRFESALGEGTRFTIRLEIFPRKSMRKPHAIST